MQTKLVIVESPVKAKTIEKYLGANYQVTSCNGHIRDLPKKEIGIDIKNGFHPTYVVESSKKSLIRELTAAAEKAEIVYLASDDDREGEAIAWHIQETLKIPQKKAKRITFRSITQSAITQSIEHPREIDSHLVDAQQARRVLDRLVGYLLSPILWRKIKGGLSAGRVQSIAVKLIVEQEKKIYAFVPTSMFKVSSQFDLGNGNSLKAELPKALATVEEAKAFLADCQSATFSIATIRQKDAQRAPSPPLTTSTLQQLASQKLGYSIKGTMSLAQRLYEEGKITYMRTDSTHLAPEAHQQIAELIQTTYGDQYYKKRTYQTQSATAQEAHEAIRPTQIDRRVGSDDERAQRLYNFIRQHTLASQMSEAIFKRTTAHVTISTRSETLTAKGEILAFKGFLAAYEHENDKTNKPLPPLQTGQSLLLDYLEARESFTRPPARYTEASLVQKLKELEIGRPSTYEPTISTIQQRGYIEKTSREGKLRSYQTLLLQHGQVSEETKQETTGTESKKLFPTNAAMVVDKFLNSYCSDIMNYDFTATTEKELDKIAHRKLSWQKMLNQFYQHFKKEVDHASEAENNIKIRKLGIDPATKEPIIARFTQKHGALIQLGNMDDEKKPRFSSLQEGQLLDFITLEEALKLFELPRKVGEFEQSPITAHIGPYGPYIKHQDKFYSLYKPHSPYTIDAATAIHVIEEKRKEPQGPIQEFAEDPTIKVLTGRYGAYIKTADRNVRIPKDKDPATLTLEECRTIIANAPAKRKNFKKKKK